MSRWTARSTSNAPLLVAVLLFLFGMGPGSRIAGAAPIVVGNNAGTASGPIESFDYATGATVGSFVPDGSVPTGNGRGVEVVGNEVFYTELSAAGPSDGIHVAPYNGGAGGSDLRLLPNPRPGAGIQDLDYAGGTLYVLTGYSGLGPLIMYGIEPSLGDVLWSVTLDPLGAGPDADGFTVLPNGNFLVNNCDACALYREYAAATGLLTGFSFSAPSSFPFVTGVDRLGDSLFFSTFDYDFDMNLLLAASILRTDLSGSFLGATSIAPTNVIEDISVIPEPSTFLLLGAGLAVMRAAAQRGRRGEKGPRIAAQSTGSTHRVRG